MRPEQRQRERAAADGGTERGEGQPPGMDRARPARKIQRDAREIDREAWEDRPLMQKMKEIFSRVWQSFL